MLAVADVHGIIHKPIPGTAYREPKPHDRALQGQRALPGRAGNKKRLVGVRGLEPRTSSLSGKRSNRLSYTPKPAPRGVSAPAATTALLYRIPATSRTVPTRSACPRPGCREALQRRLTMAHRGLPSRPRLTGRSPACDFNALISKAILSCKKLRPMTARAAASRSPCGGTRGAAGTTEARTWLSRRVFRTYTMNSLHVGKSFRDNGIEVACGEDAARCRVTPAPEGAAEAGVPGRRRGRPDSHPSLPPRDVRQNPCDTQDLSR